MTLCLPQSSLLVTGTIEYIYSNNAWGLHAVYCVVSCTAGSTHYAKASWCFQFTYKNTHFTCKCRLYSIHWYGTILWREVIDTRVGREGKGGG